MYEVYKFFNLPKIYLLKNRNVFADLVGAVFAEMVAEVNAKERRPLQKCSAN